jgi:hypothetical protein
MPRFDEWPTHEWTIKELVEVLKTYDENTIVKMGADGACRDIAGVYLSSEWWAEKAKSRKTLPDGEQDYLCISDGV